MITEHTPHLSLIEHLREIIGRMDAGIETNSETGTPDWFLGAYETLDRLEEQLGTLREALQTIVSMSEAKGGQARYGSVAREALSSLPGDHYSQPVQVGRQGVAGDDSAAPTLSDNPAKSP